MQTVRLMTAEEVAEESRLRHEAEGRGSDEASGVSASSEIDSGEALANIKADLSGLMAGKEEYPPTLRFGKSLVSKILLISGDEVEPKPQVGDSMVFRDFFTAGLRFPCDKMLPAILERYNYS